MSATNVCSTAHVARNAVRAVSEELAPEHDGAESGGVCFMLTKAGGEPTACKEVCGIS